MGEYFSVNYGCVEYEFGKENIKLVSHSHLPA